MEDAWTNSDSHDDVSGDDVHDDEWTAADDDNAMVYSYDMVVYRRRRNHRSV